jgi:hypothetical protein
LLLRPLTAEEHKYGTSTSNLKPLELDITTNHGISRVLVEPTTCKSGALTPDGSKFSSLRMNTSSIHQTTKFLMLLEAKMKKDKLLEYKIEMVEKVELLIRDGRLSILIKPPKLELKDSTKNLASTLTDHSISDQDFQ